MARVIPTFKEEVKPCELNPEEIQGFDPIKQSDLNVARSDSFILVIDLPICFKNLEDTDGRSCKYFKKYKLQMNVFGNLVPDIEIGAIPVKGWGQTLKVSSLARDAYKPITVDFTVDSNFENYFVIYKWLDIMNGARDGSFDSKNEIDRNGKMRDYSTTFSLYALDEYRAPVVRWNYTGAFPTALSNINFNKRKPEEIECSFTFEFSFLEMELL